MAGRLPVHGSTIVSESMNLITPIKESESKGPLTNSRGTEKTLFDRKHNSQSRFWLSNTNQQGGPLSYACPTCTTPEVNPLKEDRVESIPIGLCTSPPKVSPQGPFSIVHPHPPRRHFPPTPVLPEPSPGEARPATYLFFFSKAAILFPCVCFTDLRSVSRVARRLSVAVMAFVFTEALSST